MNWEKYREEIAGKGNLPEDWYILGIDLGTTNSVISFWDGGSKRPEPIDTSNGFGKIPLPSVVQYRPEDGGEGEWVVGEEAWRSIKIYPETTIRSIKRKMGTDERVELGGQALLPEEISAKILTELVDYCHSLNPKAEIAGLVVSVPYDFDDSAKKATMRAVEIAGLGDKLICLMEEPKAAALAYNFRRELAQDEKILVFDFGGGTLDITLFHVVEKNDAKIRLQVISEGGEAQHGGDNIDDILLAKCLRLIEEKNGIKPADIAPENGAELVLRAREAKERLSGVKSFRIPFTFCIPPFVELLTREQFEELCSDFIDKTRKLVQKCLREAYTGAVYPDQVDRVLLEGGSSQMPWIRDMFIEIFNDENKVYVSERPALDISLGATYYAAMKMGLLHSADMEAEDATPEVEFEVTVPHDIGLEIHNGTKRSFFPMIRRGTPYALAKKSHAFTLSGDLPEDMTGLDLKIMERMDKNDTIDDCKLIGEVAIVGLPQRPSGKTRLKVTLLVEEEGGLVKGAVEDMGFGDGYEPSGYNESFDPSRFNKRVVGK
ncbi:MAG: Hsp70 family protein [Defluviitaleaceae bacterium]|nr:Hsp70 family protein [Defluviitaleaceae bacterium]